MAETLARRQRRPKRPLVYMIVLAASGAVAMGAAWTASQAPMKAKFIWRGKPQFTALSISQDAGPAAP
jgi:hypothetical protein